MHRAHARGGVQSGWCCTSAYAHMYEETNYNHHTIREISLEPIKLMINKIIIFLALTLEILINFLVNYLSNSKSMQYQIRYTLHGKDNKINWSTIMGIEKKYE